MADVTDFLIENTKFDLPSDFLKKWLQTVGEKKLSPAEAEAEYARSEKGLRFQLIEGKALAQSNIQITFEDLIRSDDPSLAAQVIALSARLRRRTNLGLGFGLGYGVLSLASFVAIVSPLQVVASPAIAALLGSLSVLFVTLNAYSLGKLK